MFTFVAAILFFAAFLLAVGTIAWMFLIYHDKMVAALQFEPLPDHKPVYHIRVSRPRFVRRTLSHSAPVAILAA